MLKNPANLIDICRRVSFENVLLNFLVFSGLYLHYFKRCDSQTWPFCCFSGALSKSVDGFYIKILIIVIKRTVFVKKPDFANQEVGTTKNSIGITRIL